MRGATASCNTLRDRSCVRRRSEATPAWPTTCSGSLETQRNTSQHVEATAPLHQYNRGVANCANRVGRWATTTCKTSLSLPNWRCRLTHTGSAREGSKEGNNGPLPPSQRCGNVCEAHHTPTHPQHVAAPPVSTRANPVQNHPTQCKSHPYTRATDVPEADHTGRCVEHDSSPEKAPTHIPMDR